jgi:DNA-binding NarL/FixJ family response regulator
MVGALLAELLAEMDHEVCAVVMTERAAVVAAARYKPDMLIVDATLRAGSGIRAIEAIVWSRPVPYVVMSGGDLPSGVTSLLKPFREADLVRAMTSALAIADAAAALRIPEPTTILGAAGGG